MKKLIISLAVIIIVGALGFAIWKNSDRLFNGQAQPAPEKTADSGPTETKPKYPVAEGAPSAPTDEPAPTMSESDAALRKRDKIFFANTNASKLISFDNFVRNLVVSVENATGRQIPVDSSPVKAADGDLIVKSKGNQYTLSEKNYKRYQPYVDLAQSADLEKIVRYYRRIYPLFQAAYKDTGATGYFNDKVIEVIDNLLAAPEMAEPVILVRQSVRYEFADPNLESLSAIQKILIRMGPENSKIIKAKFKDLRNRLVQLGQ